MPSLLAFGGPNANSWEQVLYLGAAVALCACVGLERELRGKTAGIRTNAVIGLAAALFMEVSKFGFGDVVNQNVGLDPSRVAAQVVSGIGFVGAGIIFVHRGTVHGLTTASTAWMAAAIGLACGAGMPLLAGIVTVLHFAIVWGLARFDRKPHEHRELVVHFSSGDAQAIADAASACERAGFVVASIRTEPAADGVWTELRLDTGEVAPVVGALSAMPGVRGLEVVAADSQHE
jgi:putative Mg2+ transporter-C (MgtC) family protein